MTKNGGLCFAMLSFCLLTHTPLEAQTQDQGAVELEPTVEVLARLEQADGTVLVAGRYGGEQDDCALGSRAFIRRLAADGSELWHLYHQSFDSPPCNRRDGQLLLDPFESLDSAYVVASSLHDLVVDPSNDDIYATGEVRLGWVDASGPVSVRGAIVAHWSADGTLIRDAYLGPVPTGAPPPSGGCLMFCTLPTDDQEPDDSGEYGGRGIDLDGEEVVITGWYRERPGEDRDFFVARFAGDPLSLLWSTEAGTTGEDEGRDVAINSLGKIFMTGFGGTDRDVVVAKLHADGTVVQWLTLSGPEDDEGHSIEIDSQGDVLIDGVFSQQLTIGDQVLDAEEDSSQGWSARFGSNLNPISAHVMEVPGLPAFPNPPGFAGPGQWDGVADKARQVIGLPAPTEIPPVEHHPDHHAALPIAYEVLTGTKGRGGLRQINLSDDDYMRVVANEEQLLELKVWFDPDPESHAMPMFLGEIRAEVKSDFCYTATVKVNGVIGSDFLVAGQREMCPSDEPVLKVPITQAFSEELGFDGQVPLLPEDRLTVVLSIQFHNTPDLPDGVFGTTSEQDSSVDQISADVEY